MTLTIDTFSPIEAAAPALVVPVAPTILQGRAVACDADVLVIATAAGTVRLRINPSTSFRRLAGAGCDGLNWVPMDTGTIVGERCFCRAVFYGSGSASKEPTVLSVCALGRQGSSVVEDPSFYAPLAGWLGAFWLPTVDPIDGGVFTNILNGGVLVAGADRSDKWSYITSRNVAGMAFAFQLSGDTRFLDAAASALRFLIHRSTEPRGSHMTFRARQLRDGTPHPMSGDLLNIFVHEYCLTGPLRYLATTGSGPVGAFVTRGLDTLALFHDPQHGGFVDALDAQSLAPREGETSTKSFTSSADLMAAAGLFACELECRGRMFDPPTAAEEICGILLDRHLLPGRAFIVESLDRDWSPNTSPWRNEYATVDLAGNIGATAKVARMLAGSLPWLSPRRQDQARRAAVEIVDTLVAVGAWDALRGGVYDVMLRDTPVEGPGELVYHGDFVWWTQEQLYVASYLAYFLTGHRKYIEIARSIAAFFLYAFLAPGGGVHDTVDHLGNPVSTQMGRWVKNAYHELELLYFISVFEAAAQGRPLVLYFSPRGDLVYERALPRCPGIAWRVDSVRRTDQVVAVTFHPEVAR